MRHRPLGDSGLMVSVVGVGCNAFGSRIDADQTRAVVDAAIDAGITLFDTADSYGDGASEELLGRALGARREQVVLATKFGMGDHEAEHFGAHGSRRYVRRAVEASLRRLGTDHIDLYQLHRPDPITPVEETLGAMSELVTEGKVRYIGSSNLSAWQVVDADWVARTAGTQRFVSAQNEYSLYNRMAETELVPACEEVGVGLLPYFPLAYGLLTGKYRRGEAAPEGTRLAASSQASRLESARWDRIEALEAFARQRDVSMLQLAVGGLAAQPAVASVISGATRPEQVRANVEAGLWEPTLEDLADLDALGEDPAFSYTTFA
ncbi:aldo/keto reductase [Phycicoccus sonneratiae]|uniref:Aldo/keto reductase n=1 Tax=Phycicoccus sonneratiae TaxID=2807628 RepID=A0ABS2CT90_9MICO|nr:aldo/keto reductase [Phycicoccus sonneraticus]MBM6402324.1 aldo/keto reductase [Phycicoccus sonneraticus]